MKGFFLRSLISGLKILHGLRNDLRLIIVSCTIKNDDEVFINILILFFDFVYLACLLLFTIGIVVILYRL